ncbi:hypothetical protein ACGFK1_21335 [Mycobacterium sp. NPDC048908]|uniref:hypothetical protein n=1 Tax=Mycobacterium sp. NPDC048908 TaxID=3364292 RepID=UPI0037111E3C
MAAAEAIWSGMSGLASSASSLQTGVRDTAMNANLTHLADGPGHRRGSVEAEDRQRLQPVADPVRAGRHHRRRSAAWDVDKSQLRYVLRQGSTVERFPSVTNDGLYIRANSRVDFAFLNPAGVIRLHDAA